MDVSARYTTERHDQGVLVLDGDTFYGPLPPNGSLREVYEAWIEAGNAPQPYVAPTPAPPDNATLSDWRVALILMGRFDQVKTALEELRNGGDPVGQIAWERFEYANVVLRSELIALAETLGFSEAEVDESLWKAENVSRGIREPGPAQRPV